MNYVYGQSQAAPVGRGVMRPKDGRLSPDGKWLAYVSNESGQPEVFVQSMSDPSERAQISSEGGETPQWVRSSNELFSVEDLAHEKSGLERR